MQMRTTIRIDDDLLATAKVRAAQRGTTLTRLIEDALREALARTGTGEPDGAGSEIPTFAGRRLQPGVRLDDSVGLRDLMDGLR